MAINVNCSYSAEQRRRGRKTFGANANVLKTKGRLSGTNGNKSLFGRGLKKKPLFMDNGIATTKPRTKLRSFFTKSSKNKKSSTNDGKTTTKPNKLKSFFAKKETAATAKDTTTNIRSFFAKSTKKQESSESSEMSIGSANASSGTTYVCWIKCIMKPYTHIWALSCWGFWIHFV